MMPCILRRALLLIAVSLIIYFKYFNSLSIIFQLKAMKPFKITNLWKSSCFYDVRLFKSFCTDVHHVHLHGRYFSTVHGGAMLIKALLFRLCTCGTKSILQIVKIPVPYPHAENLWFKDYLLDTFTNHLPIWAHFVLSRKR